MAVPDSVTLRNLSGTYLLNKDLSDDTDAVLSLQGIGWLTRKAVSYSSVQLVIKQTEDAGLTKLHIIQTTTGGMESQEERALDNTLREKADKVFGQISQKTGWANISDKTDEWFSHFDQKSLDAAKGEIIVAYSESVGLSGEQWKAEQVWGFEIIDGERRHTRRIIVTRGDKVLKLRTVYDWKSE